MEATFVVPGPGGEGFIVGNHRGEILRYVPKPGENLPQAPAPEWWLEYFDAFSRYLSTLLTAYQGRINLRYSGVEEGGGNYSNCEVVLDAMSSPHNGVWLLITSRGAGTIVPLHYVTEIRVSEDRPGAYHIPRPALFINPPVEVGYALPLGKATMWGAVCSGKKGYVIPEKFIAKIIAPKCPFCLEDLVLSALAEDLGGPNARAQRHLWMCRGCAPDSVIPMSVVSTVGRKLKNETSSKSDTAGNGDPGPDDSGGTVLLPSFTPDGEIKP